MKYLILTAVLMGTVALFASNSHACTCVMPEVPQAYDEARAVFAGEVIEIVKPRTNDPKAQLADRLYTVKFKVEKSLKGRGFKDSLQEINVLSDQGRAGCLSWGLFVEGSKYLVYAGETEEKNLAVLFSCNRTASLNSASEDLRELEKLSKSSFKVQFKSTFEFE
jgi:hypothetical protein